MRRLPPAAAIAPFSPIQRFEKQFPKIYYAPEWRLDESGKRKTKGFTEHYSPLANYGVTPEKWEYFNKVIWPPNYVVPETGQRKPREVFHCIESVHLGPKKLYTANQFALHMLVDDALKQLRNHETKPTFILADLIEEAKMRAKKEFFIEDPGKMFIAEAFHIQTHIVKGARRHAHEKWHPLRYRYINLFVRLQEGDPPKSKGRLPEINGWDQMDNYYDFLRSRDFEYSI